MLSIDAINIFVLVCH